MTLPAVARDGESLLLALHVQPGASSDAVTGLHDGRVRVRIAAPALEGRANAALLRFLAAEFGVAKSQVELLEGEGGRRKRVRVNRPGRMPAWLATIEAATRGRSG